MLDLRFGRSLTKAVNIPIELYESEHRAVFHRLCGCPQSGRRNERVGAALQPDRFERQPACQRVDDHRYLRGAFSVSPRGSSICPQPRLSRWEGAQASERSAISSGWRPSRSSTSGRNSSSGRRARYPWPAFCAMRRSRPGQPSALLGFSSSSVLRKGKRESLPPPSEPEYPAELSVS